MKRVKFIANPEAGLGKGRRILPRLRGILEDRGLSFEVEETMAPKQARDLAREAVGQFDAVVAVGGDGTVSEVAQGLIHTETPLGIIPAGSGNDFVRSLGYPKELEDIVDCIAKGSVRTVDAGCLNGRYFVNVMGIGFDAVVNQRKNGTSWVKGLPAYLWALVGTLGTYSPIRVDVHLDGEACAATEAYLVSIGNGTTCGGGFRLTPYARVDDRLLDVCILAPVRVPNLLWHLPKAFNGTIEKSGYATLKTASEITLDTTESLPAHIDGEPHVLEKGRHRVRIIPEALKVVSK